MPDPAAKVEPVLVSPAPSPKKEPAVTDPLVDTIFPVAVKIPVTMTPDAVVSNLGSL